MSSRMGFEEAGRLTSLGLWMIRGAGSAAELSRVGLVAVFTILTRELNSASSFLAVPRTR